ncbi:hypothetical protein NQ315_008710 [Exocentrus adspersus]|uniref:Uncharacterized protein n=1 Tax=Exocentrus adspersus TaxID=1586481 RepID=A0AAV8W6K2_9CUCU|nr:hypothetical protein NQ315_008710 [Exocentrus adspersus]
MVQIAGKYKVVENKNFYEFLLGLGIPEERAKEGNKTGGESEILVDGEKITFKDEHGHVIEFVLDKEVEEKRGDLVFLSTAKLDGNTLTVIAKAADGNRASLRTWTFTDSELNFTITIEKDGKNLTASRKYKRI